MAARTFSRSSRTLMMVVVFAALTFADQTITRHTGMNVTLEFQNPNGITSWWLKRLGSDKYISYCQDRTPTRTRDQEESFQGRVEGTDCDIINKVVSVTLSNLTESDSGPYEFHWVGSDDGNSSEIILLNVTDSGPGGGATEDEEEEEDGETDEKSRGHYCIIAVLAFFIVVVVVVMVSKVCPTSMKEDLQRLLNSALIAAKTKEQEVMERAASIPFLGQTV